MDRRLFLFAGLAGVTDPVTPMLNAVSAPPVTTSGDAAFDSWSRDFLSRAVGAGWPEALIRAQFQGLAPDPRVVAADHRQPEFSRPIGDYIRSAVSPARIAAGRQKLQALSDGFARIQARFAVDPAVLVAIWGVESGYGVEQGSFDVVRSLATLAADGRRRSWAEAELFKTFTLISSGRALRGQLKGSWAGAMGQTQLEPSELLNRGVDMDGDGKVDIWESAPDALGSTANILKSAGWRLGESWAGEVTLPPGFDYSLAEGPKQTPDRWAALGVKRADGQPWSAADAAAACQLLVPAGALGPAFLVFPNHFVIRAYNNSMSYALSVGLIADGVLGAPPLKAAWPQEPPLSSADRIGAQTALKAMGFDPGETDGVIGPQTRVALRRWQSARGLIPDGHLTPDLSQRLQAEAAGKGGVPPSSQLPASSS